MNNCENGNPTSTEFIIKIYKSRKELQFDLPYLPPLLKRILQFGVIMHLLVLFILHILKFLPLQLTGANLL